MHLIKSGFEFKLHRLIRHVKNFIFAFQIELIRLIIKKNFETLFSKVCAQVTQTSLCLCLGVKLDSSGWSEMHFIIFVQTFGWLETSLSQVLGCIYLLNTRKCYDNSRKYCGNTHEYWPNTWKMCSPASAKFASIVTILGLENPDFF